MQQVDRTCPNCLGRVVPYGDGTYGTCEYSGSLFKLDAGTAVAAEETRKREPPAKKVPSEGDFKRLFQSFYEGLDNEDQMELWKDLCFAGLLQTHKKKEAQARKCFFSEKTARGSSILFAIRRCSAPARRALLSRTRASSTTMTQSWSGTSLRRRNSGARADASRSMTETLSHHGRGLDAHPREVSEKAPGIGKTHLIFLALLRREADTCPSPLSFGWRLCGSRILEIGVNEWLPLRGHTT